MEMMQNQSAPNMKLNSFNFLLLGFVIRMMRRYCTTLSPASCNITAEQELVMCLSASISSS